MCKNNYSSEVVGHSATRNGQMKDSENVGILLRADTRLNIRNIALEKSATKTLEVP